MKERTSQAGIPTVGRYIQFIKQADRSAIPDVRAQRDNRKPHWRVLDQQGMHAVARKQLFQP